MSSRPKGFTGSRVSMVTNRCLVSIRARSQNLATFSRWRSEKHRHTIYNGLASPCTSGCCTSGCCTTCILRGRKFSGVFGGGEPKRNWCSCWRNWYKINVVSALRNLRVVKWSWNNYISLPHAKEKVLVFKLGMREAISIMLKKTEKNQRDLFEEWDTGNCKKKKKKKKMHNTPQRKIA